MSQQHPGYVPAVPPQPPPKRPINYNLIGLALGGAALGLLALVLVLTQMRREPKAVDAAEDEPRVETRTRPASATAVTSAVASSTPKPAPPPPTASPMDTFLAIRDASAALKAADAQDSQGDTDVGAIKFALWSSKNLTWKDVGVTTDETSAARVMKDSEAERGKRACWSGSIIEIAVDRSAGRPLYVGGLHSGANIIRFVAVRSTGDLVGRSPARICGYVTGRQSYSNSGGGTTHAVFVVGMFDLPENRAITP